MRVVENVTVAKIKSLWKSGLCIVPGEYFSEKETTSHSLPSLLNICTRRRHGNRGLHFCRPANRLPLNPVHSPPVDTVHYFGFLLMGPAVVVGRFPWVPEVKSAN